jgi:serine/threonine-protein kinase
MGDVFSAENIRTGRTVALKLLRVEVRQKSSAIERFRREARAAGAISSDYVTQVLDVEEDPEHGIVLVFELLEGESLIERLKRTGPIAYDELHGLVEQLWMGLAAAHAAGIVHRDLKPSNVFLERRPEGQSRIKILDFGISKVPKGMGGETLTDVGQSLGTFSFMPPEQIGKAKLVDHRADIYAGATLIYQSLTGQLPYAAANIFTMIELKKTADPRSLAEAMGTGVDPRLEAFVARGLARDPNDRFPSASDALAAWHELRPGAVSARAPSVVLQPSPLSPHLGLGGTMRMDGSPISQAVGVVRPSSMASIAPDWRPSTPSVSNAAAGAPMPLPYGSPSRGGGVDTESSFLQDQTTVYRRQAPFSPSAAQRAARALSSRGFWPVLLGAVLMLVVGFGFVAIVLRYLVA